MPLDVLFEVKEKFYQWLPAYAHRRSTSSGFLASYSQGHHPPFQNKSNFPGYSDDEKCDLRLEGGKGAIGGARVPLKYERATVGGPSVREPLSGSQKTYFSHSVSVLTLSLTDPHRVAARKTYPSPSLPSCVGFA
jgi:hypothetical protein